MKLLNNYYLNTVYIWVVLIIASLLFNNIYMLTATIAYTGYLPHINVVLWLSISETGVRIRRKIELWHWTILISYIFVLYSVYAQSWSAALINETFYIDPAKLGITDSIVTFLIAPVSLLYYPDLMGAIQTLAMLASMFLFPMLFLVFLPELTIWSVLKLVFKLFAILSIISTFVTMMFSFHNHLNDVVIKLAISTDFNKFHPCTDEWAEKADSLIFLGGDRVYVFFPNDTSGDIFQFKRCDFKGSSFR